MQLLQWKKVCICHSFYVHVCWMCSVTGLRWKVKIEMTYLQRCSTLLAYLPVLHWGITGYCAILSTFIQLQFRNVAFFWPQHFLPTAVGSSYCTERAIVLWSNTSLFFVVYSWPGFFTDLWLDLCCLHPLEKQSTNQTFVCGIIRTSTSSSRISYRHLATHPWKHPKKMTSTKVTSVDETDVGCCKSTYRNNTFFKQFFLWLLWNTLTALLCWLKSANMNRMSGWIKIASGKLLRTQTLSHQDGHIFRACNFGFCLRCHHWEVKAHPRLCDWMALCQIVKLLKPIIFRSVAFVQNKL